MQHVLGFLCVLLLVHVVITAPPPSLAPSVAPAVTYASDDPNYPLWGPDSDIIPEPIRGSTGNNILGPQNIPIDLQNPDTFAPPSTDNGAV